MKSIWKFLNTREEALHFLLSKPKTVVMPVTFLKIENEIRMLAAFYGLLKAGDKKFKRKKAFKPYKKLGGTVSEVSALQQQEYMLANLFEKDQLLACKRDVKRLRESKRAEYIKMVDEKYISELGFKKGQLDSLLRKINKKLVQDYLKKKSKKISKIILKSDLSASTLDDLRNRMLEFTCLQSLVQRVKPEKDGLAQQLDNWKAKHTDTLSLKTLKGSGVFSAKELSLIKKTEEKLLAEESEMVAKISEIIATPQTEI